MRQKQDIKIITIIFLIIIVFSLAIAYATLSQQLNIRGTAGFHSAKWSVRFNGVSGKVASGDPNFVKYTLPDVADTSLKNFKVTLSEPGDSVTFTISVINDGEIDAELGSLTKLTPKCTGLNADTSQALTDANAVCDNLTYTLKYADTKADVSTGDLINQGQTKKIELTYTMKAGATPIPSDDVIVSNLDITFVYNQVI